MQRPIALAALVLLGTSACGPSSGNGNDVACKSNLLPGDLVISEVMANPDGDDAGKEYFEVYNAADEPLDLTGMALEYSREDLTGEASHILPEVVVQPGDYFVFGGVLDDFKPDYVDYGYGNAFAMRNGGARLALQCDDVEVDSLVYPEMTDQGVAFGLDGSSAPDYMANDDPANLCPQTTEFIAGEFGTPGEANEACDIVTPGQCDDGGTMRPVVAPEQGDLVITEVMPNPDFAPDATGEWFEVMATADVDLNGLVVGSGDNTDTVQSSSCVSLKAGDFALFARSAAPAENGDLPTVDSEFSFNLSNSGSNLYLKSGGTEIDAVTWSGSSAGVSIQLSSSTLDPVANDDESNFCDGTMDFGHGDLGTPRAANEMCPVMCDAGMCFDGDSCRAINPPQAADVTITEYMPKPSVGPNGEWFEVHFDAAADLNDLAVEDSNDNPNTIVSQNCVTVAANSDIVFARTKTSADNGGIPTVDHTFTFGLNDGGDTITVLHDTTTLDEVVYPSGQVMDGQSYKIDQNGVGCFEATETYGDDNQNGTPGLPNPDC